MGFDKLPTGEKAVGSTWVMLYKSDKDGLITETKARITSQDFVQRDGVDSFLTSAPAPAAASFKIVIDAANELNYKVTTKAKLDCVVYTNLPGGCGDWSGKFVRLKKVLYVLKQNDLLWNNLQAVKLVTVHGMGQCKTDPCAFGLIQEGKAVLILTVHIDDMAVAGPREGVTRYSYVVFNEDFTTNDLGELSFFTGCAFSCGLEEGYP